MVNGSADDELSASEQELPTKERLLTEQYRLRIEVEQYQRVLDQTDDIAEADGYLAKLLQGPRPACADRRTTQAGCRHHRKQWSHYRKWNAV